MDLHTQHQSCIGTYTYRKKNIIFPREFIRKSDWLEIIHIHLFPCPFGSPLDWRWTIHAIFRPLPNVPPTPPHDSRIRKCSRCISMWQMAFLIHFRIFRRAKSFEHLLTDDLLVIFIFLPFVGPSSAPIVCVCVSNMYQSTISSAWKKANIFSFFSFRRSFFSHRYSGRELICAEASATVSQLPTLRLATEELSTDRQLSIKRNTYMQKLLSYTTPSDVRRVMPDVLPVDGNKMFVVIKHMYPVHIICSTIWHSTILRAGVWGE